MTATATRRRMHIPVEGDYLADGARLVEVVARTPKGWRVLDAVKPLDARCELIPTADLPRWEFVAPEHEEEHVAG